jgi:hypothetical protein
VANIAAALPERGADVLDEVVEEVLLEVDGLLNCLIVAENDNPENTPNAIKFAKNNAVAQMSL